MKKACPPLFPAFALASLLFLPSRIAANSTAIFTRVAVMGDSITGQTGDGPIYYRSGLWSTLSSRLLQQLDLVWNGSVPYFASSGKDSAFIEANDLPLVLQSNAQACILMAGTNDYYQGRTPAAVAAILGDMCRVMEAHGITPVLCDVLPIAAGIPDKSAWLVALKSEVDALCAADPLIIHIDWFRVLDPDGDGVADSIYFADGLHPTSNGMSRLGSYAATLLQPHVRSRDFLSGITWLTPNPTLEGSGLVPTGWSYDDGSSNGNVVAIGLLSHPSGGNWWQIAVANANSYLAHIQLNGPIVSLTTDQSGGASSWAAGDAVEVVAEFETDPGISPNWNLIPFATAYPSYHVSADSVTGAGGDNMAPVSSGILRTPPLILPAGTTAIGCRLELTGTGILRLGRVGVRKLPPSFATWILASSVTDKTPDGDPDGDGIPNQMEWLLGGDPAINDAAGLTALQLTGPPILRPNFAFRVAPRSIGDSQILLQRSANLATWSDFTIGTDTASDITQDPADPTRWIVRGATSPAFFRLRAAWKE